MGVPEEHQILLPHEPKSMDHGSRPPSPPSIWRRLRNADDERSERRRTVFRHLLGISVFFAVLFIWSMGFFRPDAADVSSFQTPMMTTTSFDDEMKWEPISTCLKEPRKFAKTAEEITFGTHQSLSIVQKSNRDGYRHGNFRSPRVFGQVDLTPLPNDSNHLGRVELQVISNIEALDVDVQFDRVTQEFTVITPKFVDWDERWGACIQIHINVSIPVDADLASLVVDAQSLNINIEDGVALHGLQRSVLASIIGNVATGSVSGGSDMTTPYALDSREVVIETVSGDVKGWFPFYDLVKIETVSGDITVDLTPKPASDDDDEQQQARLDISSLSGHLVVKEKWLHEENQGLPIRDYVTHLTTASGSIEANVAFTSDATVDSQSGDLTLHLLPVSGAQSPDSEPHVHTNTKSGRSEISILEPLQSSEEDMLSSLISKHNSITGNVNLHYPASWTGQFIMTSMTGSQVVRGQGVKFTRGGGFVKRIRGENGDGKSEMTVDSMSGDQELLVGQP